MQTLNCGGRPFGLALFIRAYGEALKVAPGRFLTLRIHPSTWELLIAEAEEITHVVHWQEVMGPLGRRQVRVACVPAPKGLGDGIAVVQDRETERNKLVFEIHGIPEIEVSGFIVPMAPEPAIEQGNLLPNA